MKKTLLSFCIVLLFTGCATQTYYVNGTNGGGTPDQNTRQTFFVSGIGQEKTINAAEICGGATKVEKVQSKLDVVDVVLGMLTWGIYTPRTAIVYCTK